MTKKGKTRKYTPGRRLPIYQVPIKHATQESMKQNELIWVICFFSSPNGVISGHDTLYMVTNEKLSSVHAY